MAILLGRSWSGSYRFRDLRWCCRRWLRHATLAPTLTLFCSGLRGGCRDFSGPFSSRLLLSRGMHAGPNPPAPANSAITSPGGTGAHRRGVAGLVRFGHMNAGRSLSVHRTAWSVLSAVAFLWLLAFLWDWPMALPVKMGVLLGGAGAAVIVGWVLQFLWGLAAPVLSRPSQPQSTRSRWLVLIAMALAAPVLADCVHTLCVVNGGIRFYNAELSHAASPLFWVSLAVRGALALLLIWPFARTPLRHRTMWICCVGLWTYLDFKSEVVLRW